MVRELLNNKGVETKSIKIFSSFDEAYANAPKTKLSFELYQSILDTKRKRIQGRAKAFYVINDALYYQMESDDGLRLINSFSPYSVMNNLPFKVFYLFEEEGFYTMGEECYSRSDESRRILAQTELLYTTENI